MPCGLCSTVLLHFEALSRTQNNKATIYDDMGDLIQIK